MPANTAKKGAFQQIKGVNHRTTDSLTYACDVYSKSRNTKSRELKPSLTQLMIDIHKTNISGLNCSLRSLSTTFGHDYFRCITRTNELIELGYIERVSAITSHSDEYANIRFSYYVYSLSKQGIRFLRELFEIVD